MQTPQAMRSLCFVFLLVLLSTRGVQAQGTISFHNDEGTSITNGMTGEKVVAGTS